MKNYYQASVIALTLTALLSPLTWSDELDENQARFGTITGQVTVLSSGAAEWVEVHEGMPILAGDQIHVAEESQAEFVVSQNAMWILHANTDLIPESMNENSGRFNLPSGSIVGKVDSSQVNRAQKWDFNTPTAVCGIRGTEFAILTSRTEGTNLAVFEGQVEMAPAEGAEGQAPPVRVGAHQEYVAERGRVPHRLEKFSPRMKELFAQRGDLRTRMRRVQNTWSPDTRQIRKGLRDQFVKPTNKLPKNKLAPRKVIRRRKA